jgi:hypothetical protein
VTVKLEPGKTYYFCGAHYLDGFENVALTAGGGYNTVVSQELADFANVCTFCIASARYQMATDHAFAVPSDGLKVCNGHVTVGYRMVGAIAGTHPTQWGPVANVLDYGDPCAYDGGSALTDKLRMSAHPGFVFPPAGSLNP